MGVILDQLVYELRAGRALTVAAITGSDGLLKELTRRLVERVMRAELTDHLDYDDPQSAPAEQSNQRNGGSTLTLVTEHGRLRINVPRDRDGSFEPQIGAVFAFTGIVTIVGE